MKILVIEDEKLLAESIKEMLERKGFQVEAVYDGETGKEYAELGIYDLLILDVMMPKMDGYEVARQVRMNRCNTPILMLTAKSDVADRIAGLNAGADYYLTKPFDSGELLASINALLRRQAGQGGMNFENFASEEDVTTLDIGEAHISVEIEGGKESGSMDNIQPGTFVTVTVNGKGKATYVLVSSQSFFGGGRGFAK